jgi:hypothetical protein
MALLLCACSANAGSGGDPSKKLGQPASISQGSGVQPRDYYFPSSAGYRATYTFISNNELPPPFATDSTHVTGTVTFETTAYTATTATVQATTHATYQDGETETQISTSSLRVLPDGTVASDEQGVPLRYTSGIFTAAGADIVPASGSANPAMRAFLLGEESVSVPAGTFSAFHLGQQIAQAGAPITHFWVARGVGLVRQSENATYSILTSENTYGVASTTFEMRLESHTP